MASLATQYTYNLTSSEKGLNIELVRTADGATKHFFLAGARPEHLQGFMDSLTDACCEGFFHAARRKAEPKSSKA